MARRAWRGHTDGVPRLRISYNAPVILTFAAAALAVYALPGVVQDPHLGPTSLKAWFVAYPQLGGP